jgi:hypothetical protein
MKTKFTRWYDKDPRLKAIITFLEKSPEEVRIDVAMDIIQLIIQENFTSSDQLIDFARANYIGTGQRWYDSDEMVHTAVEMLKLLSEAERNILLREVADSLIYFSASNIREKNERSTTGNRYLPD